MGRPSTPDAATGVREALIATLAGHVRETMDPRWVLIPEEQWPSPMPPYVDRIADRYDDLVAGKPVDVPAFMISRLADFPRDWHHVRIDVDGTISRAEYDGRAGA